MEVMCFYYFFLIIVFINIRFKKFLGLLNLLKIYISYIYQNTNIIKIDKY